MNKYLICIFIFLTIISNLVGQTIYDTTYNKIQNIFQNQNWQKFALKMQNLNSTTNNEVQIVHLGDSHIQGGYFTNEVRKLLSQKYGTISRGWVFPYNLAHSNGPDDISIKSTSVWTGLKYNHNHNTEYTNISGYNLESTDSTIKMSVFLKNESKILYPFTSITFFHNDPLLIIDSPFNPQVITNKEADDFYMTKISYKELHDSIPLVLNTHKNISNPFSLTGLNLLNKNAALTYHSIGINGMAYITYEKAIDYKTSIGILNPDCIIISLGTNDAFMQVRDTAQLKQLITSIIANIYKVNPSCCIILTTAGDHLKNRKTVNPFLIKINESIIAVAIKQHCVYWDFFKVMGGLGSSYIWKKNDYLFRDFVHLSKEGYKLQGKLFFEALNNAIMQTKPHGMD